MFQPRCLLFRAKLNERVDSRPEDAGGVADRRPQDELKDELPFIQTARLSPVFDGLMAPSHLLVLALVVLLIFGPKRLPDIGRSLGTGIRELKESLTGHDEEPPPSPAAELTGQRQNTERRV